MGDKSGENMGEAVMNNNQHIGNDDQLNACIHCGLCLSDCPTYKITGDEANSPRGRLALWQAESEGRIGDGNSIDFYTDECVGCLACESACPSNVPYGEYLEKQRRKQILGGRGHINWKVAIVGKMIKNLKLFNFLSLPIRIARAFGFNTELLFAGKPAIFESSSAYAERLRKKYNPSGPRVALLTGCLMDCVFREINFATIEVLMKHDINVVIPNDQGCCGAIYEHTGMYDPEILFEHNQQIFSNQKVEVVLSNSSGCGLSLAKALKPVGIKVMDVMTFLGELNLPIAPKKTEKIRLYVDLPCHLVHGQKIDGIPSSVLDSTGYEWELAPGAMDCCGSGGSYNIQKPENAKSIIKEKASFIDKLPADIRPCVVTSNHVCMMQWNSAKKYVSRDFDVKHLIQLL
jgi:glycolate oxidase iron-sulfur subunit